METFMFYKRIKTTFRKSTKISPLTWLHELSDDILLSVDGKPLLLSVLMFRVTLCIDRAAQPSVCILLYLSCNSALVGQPGWWRTSRLSPPRTFSHRRGSRAEKRELEALQRLRLTEKSGGRRGEGYTAVEQFHFYAEISLDVLSLLDSRHL